MRIDEIFYSIQGEGTHRGRPCAFVRLTGCPLRCRWCDTAYAFAGGRERSVTSILEELEGFGVDLVCVTGGEPLAQAEVHDLMAALVERGWTVLLETSGAVDARSVDERVIRILDLKAPGSGEVSRTHEATFAALRPTDEVKIVVADRTDYEWARKQIVERRLPERVSAVLLGPVHGELADRELAEWILEDRLPVVLQRQEHKLLWPERDRGV